MTLTFMVFPLKQHLPGLWKFGRFFRQSIVPEFKMGQKFISAHFACGAANEMRADYMLECPRWEPIANPYNGPFKVFPHSSWPQDNSEAEVPAIGIMVQSLYVSVCQTFLDISSFEHCTSTSLMFNFVPTSTSPRTQFEVTQHMLVLSFLDHITNIPANYLGFSTSTLPERGDLIDLGSQAQLYIDTGSTHLKIHHIMTISKGRTKESDEEIQFVRTHGACGSSEPVQDAPVSTFVPILLNCPTPQAKEN
ncbi:hypothetical protein B0H16DRAFT_1455675 [Mycena metata]|uniref:Uncharacterized protein n=1 Tax=Mycena metata TaxID=1033252 RepID=A0AAD7NIK8_9AGAR|nr:hypothetical protein B0H16DRAFT_1455675 [Mycena metata]